MVTFKIQKFSVIFSILAFGAGISATHAREVAVLDSDETVVLDNYISGIGFVEPGEYPELRAPQLDPLTSGSDVDGSPSFKGESAKKASKKRKTGETLKLNPKAVALACFPYGEACKKAIMAGGEYKSPAGSDRKNSANSAY